MTLIRCQHWQLEVFFHSLQTKCHKLWGQKSTPLPQEEHHFFSWALRCSLWKAAVAITCLQTWQIQPKMGNGTSGYKTAQRWNMIEWVTSISLLGWTATKSADVSNKCILSRWQTSILEVLSKNACDDENSQPSLRRAQNCSSERCKLNDLRVGDSDLLLNVATRSFGTASLRKLPITIVRVLAKLNDELLLHEPWYVTSHEIRWKKDEIYWPHWPASKGNMWKHLCFHAFDIYLSMTMILHVSCHAFVTSSHCSHLARQILPQIAVEPGVKAHSCTVSTNSKAARGNLLGGKKHCLIVIC